MPIFLPPLRDRLEDLPLLLEHFVSQHAERRGRAIRFSKPALVEQLAAHDWPGNVRELENAIERSVVLCHEDTLEEILIRAPTAPGVAPSSAPVRTAAHTPPSAMEGTLRDVRQEAEEVYLRHLLEERNGDLAAVSTVAGVDPKTLYRKMKQYGLKRADFRRADA